MQQFPWVENSSDNLLFEKSANYFTENSAPLRISNLLPKVKLICIIIDPSVRAYSWYQVQTCLAIYLYYLMSSIHNC